MTDMDNSRQDSEAYYSALKQEIFGEDYPATKGAPIITMQLRAAYNDLTAFQIYDLMVDLYQEGNAEIHVLDVHGAPDKTVLKLEWKGATELLPFSQEMNETLKQKLGPHSGTLYRYGVQSIATDHQVWELR